MAHWAMTRGSFVFLIPTSNQTVSLASYIDEIDGLVLQGGSDVAPESYGETPLKPEWKGDRIRDIYERELIKLCFEKDIPILGACRGQQIINAAFGGTMYQDINTQVEGTLVHRSWDIYDQNFHDIRFTEGSLLHKLHQGKIGGTVNSVHHQSIKDLAPGFRVEAVSTEDDIIEAIRYLPEDVDASDPLSFPYVYAVQWHPEFQDPTDHNLLSPYAELDDFLAVAKAKRNRRNQ